MSWWSAFRKKEKIELPPVDLSVLELDMHSHLIPGIDDGSKSMDETIAMMAKFEDLGFKRLVTTPHIMADFYRNTPDIILGGLEKVKSTAQQIGLKINIEAAAEYYFDDSLMSRLKNKEQLLTFCGNHMLFEFSMLEKPSGIEELVFELTTQDYTPVLAHFERYRFYFGNPEKALWFKENGVKIQLNLLSLTGHYGPDVKKQAEAIVDLGCVDFVASDCHRIEHLMKIEKGKKLEYFHKVLALDLLNSKI